MAILFTDPELRTASKEFLDIPARNSLLDLQDDQTDAGQADALAQDAANEVFYENYLNITKRYHTELKNLDGTTKTDYNTADLVNAAKVAPGNIHFIISPPWVNFPPKLHDSVIGLPSAVVVGSEFDRLAIVQAAKDQLISGYSDGGVSDLLQAPYAGGVFRVVTGGFSVGQRVVLTQGGTSAYGVIASITLPPPGPSLWAQEITITEFAAPGGSLGIGAAVKSFDGGFSNAEREHTIASHAPEYQAYLEGVLSAEVTSIKTYLLAQQVALAANDAVGADAAEIAQALLDVASALFNYTTFESAPPTGGGVGRYGDSVLGPLQSTLTTRALQIPARTIEIATRLGGVSQAGDGSFSGTGQYFNLFKWIDLRLSKSGGSLTKFYSFDLIKNFISSTQGTNTNKLNEYTDVILVVKLTADADGTQFIQVQSATGWNPGDSVFLLDDNSGIPTLPATIVGIVGLIIELSAPASGFTIDQVARLVKYL